MTNKELYKSTFSAVTVSNETRTRINSSICNISSAKMINKKSYRTVLVLVVLMTLMAITAVAVVNRVDIGGWFNSRWKQITGTDLSEAQTDTIIELTNNINSAVTCNEMTVTAESILVGDNRVELLLSVKAPDFIPLKNHSYKFEYCDVQVIQSEFEKAKNPLGKSYYIDFYSLDETKNTVYLMLHFTTSLPIGSSIRDGDYSLKISLRDFMDSSTKNMDSVTDDESVKNADLITSGEWTFDIPLDFNSPEANIKIDNAYGNEKCKNSKEKVSLEYSDIVISSTGIRFAVNKKYKDTDCKIYTELNNGTKVPCLEGSQIYSSDSLFVNCSYSWLSPISINDIKSINLGETTIQLDTNK
jgi:hypothetical protein